MNNQCCTKGGIQKDPQEIWRAHEGQIVEPTSLLNILIADAHGFDHCTRGEVILKIKQQGFWSPYLKNPIPKKLGHCTHCQ